MTTTIKSEEEGPSYFGFVKDTSGRTMPDVKVTVGIKDRGGVVTRTDALGAYKVPGFGKEVDPKDVEVACDKPGYRQTAHSPPHASGERGSEDSGRDRVHDAAHLGTGVWT